MGNIKVVLNREGVRQLLMSNEMMDICAEHARATLEGCGNGYAMDTYVGQNRVNAMVFAETALAKADNSMNNTILKALK